MVVFEAAEDGPAAGYGVGREGRGVDGIVDDRSSNKLNGHQTSHGACPEAFPAIRVGAPL